MKENNESHLQVIVLIGVEVTLVQMTRLNASE